MDEGFILGATIAVTHRLFIPPNVHAGRRKGNPYTLHAILGLYTKKRNL
jgi:hypothetical protein